MDEPQTHIVELICSNGDIYPQSMWNIKPFSASSFIARPKHDPKKFLIIPTRCVDRIWMEEAGNEAVDQS